MDAGPHPNLDWNRDIASLKERVHGMIRSFGNLQAALTPEMRAQAKGLAEEIDTAITSLSILSMMLNLRQEQAKRSFGDLLKS